MSITQEYIMDEYELLCVDYQNKSHLKSEANFLYYLMSLGVIWEVPKLNYNKITDKNGSSVIVNKISNQSSYPETTIFQLTFSGEFEHLEKVRLIILSYLKKQGYEKESIYVLKDTISKEIARKLYPLINEVETSLRKYLIKFFVIKIGPNWWKMTVDVKTATKATNRVENEKAFVDFIDNNIYLIDFSDLGKMVYSHSTSFIDKDNLLAKISKMEETTQAIKDLKTQLESNYTKFFKGTFKDKGFEDKWKKLEAIRNKVAHNNLFEKDDQDKGVQLSEELNEIIRNAIEKIEMVSLSVEEIEAIRDNISDRSNGCKIHILSHTQNHHAFYVSDNGGRIILNGGFYKTKGECYKLIESLKLAVTESSNFRKIESGMTTSFVLKDNDGNQLGVSAQLKSGLDLNRDIEFLQQNFKDAQILEITPP